MSGPRTLVVGIGQDARGDDAFGLLVARGLRADRRCADLSLEIREHDGDGMELALALEGRQTVILVDAVVSASQSPGALLRLDARAAPLPARLFAPHSSHHFGVAQAVELARVTGRLPPRLLFFGVVANAFEFAAPPSAAVAEAVPATAERILGELSSP